MVYEYPDEVVMARAEAHRQQVNDLAEAVNLLGQLTDAEDCSFDHHGDCQAHGFFDLTGCLCPHQAAKNLIAKITGLPVGGDQ